VRHPLHGCKNRLVPRHAPGRPQAALQAVAILVFVVVVAAGVPPAMGVTRAAPGDLDVSFDGDGKNILVYGAGDIGRDLLVKPHDAPLAGARVGASEASSLRPDLKIARVSIRARAITSGGV